MINKKGQALVEFILVLPVIILLIFVVFDIGHIILAKNHLENVMSDCMEMHSNGKDITEIRNHVNSDKEYNVEVSSWTSNYPHELGNENNYNNSWYKGELTLDNIPNGDYDLYFKTTKGNYYSRVILDNIYSRPIDRRGEDSKHGYNFKVELKLKTRPVEKSALRVFLTGKKRF